MKELLDDLDTYERDWANTDPDIQDAALDAVGAQTIDDVVVTWSGMDEEDLANAVWLWKDFLDVVAHKEHELGL